MQRRSLYSLHPAYDMIAAFEVNLPQRTGKNIDEWIAFVKAEGPADPKARRAWLKEQGLTTNYAWHVAERAEGRGSIEEYDPEALVEAQYTGAKARLRPIYDKLLALGFALGDDVKACPCKTMVPLYREHVFAEIKPTTNTRIDLELALVDTKFTDRLMDSGGRAKKDRRTHRVGLTHLDDIDSELRGWLKAAYDLADPKEEKERKNKKAPKAVPPVPDDLAKALAKSKKAKAAWEKLTPAHRREHIEGILEAKKPETRSRRIAKAIEMLEKGAPK